MFNVIVCNALTTSFVVLILAPFFPSVVQAETNQRVTTTVLTTSWTVQTSTTTITPQSLLQPSNTVKTVKLDSATAQISNVPQGAMSWSGQKFEDAVINSTNTWRSQHNASDLTWNNTLAQFAGNHAQGCIWEHSGGPYGENLALNYPSPTTAIDAWGNEEQQYDYSKPSFSESTGHFTQLVWKDTVSVGCGAVNCSNSGTPNGAQGWYLVCEYYPPGNVKGAFESNVVQSKDGGKLSVGKDNSASGFKGPPAFMVLFLAGIAGALCISGL